MKLPDVGPDPLDIEIDNEPTEPHGHVDESGPLMIHVLPPRFKGKGSCGDPRRFKCMFQRIFFVTCDKYVKFWGA